MFDLFLFNFHPSMWCVCDMILNKNLWLLKIGDLESNYPNEDPRDKKIIEVYYYYFFFFWKYYWLRVICL